MAIITKTTATALSTEDIVFNFERFFLARGMSFKLDFTCENGLQWFECFDEALERYNEWGIDALMDYYDPEGHNIFSRVFEQDNTADRNRTYNGSKKYLEDQLRAYTNFTYTALRNINKFSGENRRITGGFIYPAHDGSTQDKRYEFVRKFVADLAKWYGEDTTQSTFDKKVLSIG